jgi:hypothetical protein
MAKPCLSDEFPVLPAPGFRAKTKKTGGKGSGFRKEAVAEA